MIRDVDAETRFLERASTGDVAGPDSWSARVRARLDRGQTSFGDAWAARPLDELLQELREEAEDLGGWAALAAQHPDLAQLGAAERAALLKALQRVAGLGAYADKRLDAIGR